MNHRAKTLHILGESGVMVFVNSAAGGGRACAYLGQIQKLFASFQVQAQFAMTNSAAELEGSAQNALSQGRRALIAMGGDGTFHALANAAFGTDALLGVLPLGGGNDFAAALGLPKDPVKAAEALLRGHTRFVDLARVRTAEGRTRLYAGGGGIGLDARALQYANGMFRHFPGRFRYIASALRAFARYVPVQVRLEFPGCDFGTTEAKVLLAGVLNTPTYGSGVRLAPGADMSDGLLEVVLLENLDLFEVLALLPRLIASGEVRTSRLRRWRTQRVRLTAARSSLFHGDGEIIGPTPVEIEAVPRAIQVLAPSSE
jgi:diacylglycerol kinase (ATP)